MMRKRNALVAEQGFCELLPRAHEHASELMAAFAQETQHGVRCWLLELICEARSEQAFDLLCEQAQSEDEAFRVWAVRGLQRLDTHAARKFLFDHGLKA